MSLTGLTGAGDPLPQPLPDAGRGARGMAGFFVIGWAGGTLVAEHLRHGRRDFPSTQGNRLRAEDRVRHGCIAFNAGLCCTCVVVLATPQMNFHT